MAVVATIFSIMAYFYIYVYYGANREDGENEPLISDGAIQLEERDKEDDGDKDDDSLLKLEEESKEGK